MPAGAGRSLVDQAVGPGIPAVEAACDAQQGDKRGGQRPEPRGETDRIVGAVREQRVSGKALCGRDLGNEFAGDGLGRSQEAERKDANRVGPGASPLGQGG